MLHFQVLSACLVAKLYHSRLVPSRYLSVFWDERRLGIRLRHAQGLMRREEGKIATLFFLLPFP